MTKYIAAYLSLLRDLHKNIQLEPNSFEYIKNYYDSIIILDLTSIIVVDDASDEFISHYANRNVSFYKIQHELDLDIMLNIKHLHDLRFVYFLELIIKDTTTDYFMLTDISDVVIINPIQNIIDIDNNTIYVGKENQNISENIWFNDTYSKLMNTSTFGDTKQVFRDKTLLNCGILFGHRDILIDFLTTMTKLMIDIYQNDVIDIVNKPIDMFLVNYVGYKYFDIYDGSLLNTSFAQNEYDTTKCVKHK